VLFIQFMLNVNILSSITDDSAKGCLVIKVCVAIQYNFHFILGVIESTQYRYWFYMSRS